MPTTAIASTTAAIMLSINVNPRCRGARGSIIGERCSNGIRPEAVRDDLLGRGVVLPPFPTIGDQRILRGNLDRVSFADRVLRHLREVRTVLEYRSLRRAGDAHLVREHRHLLDEVAVAAGRGVLVLGLVDDDLRAQVAELVLEGVLS